MAKDSLSHEVAKTVAIAVNMQTVLLLENRIVVCSSAVTITCKVLTQRKIANSNVSSFEN